MAQPSPFTLRVAETDEDFEQVFHIRRAVFGGEQDVPEDIDLDGHDAEAHHYLLMHGDAAAGTARWRITAGGMIKLERFAVLPQYRGMGGGTQLVLAILARVPRTTEIYLNAQEQVIPFYEKLGFLGVGDYFSEANIRHQKMVYPY